MNLIIEIKFVMNQLKHIKFFGQPRWWLGLTLAIIVSLIPKMALAQEEEASGGFVGTLDSVFSQLVSVLDKILFFEIAGFPPIVLWLICGSIFFTFAV